MYFIEDGALLLVSVASKGFRASSGARKNEFSLLCYSFSDSFRFVLETELFHYVNQGTHPFKSHSATSSYTDCWIDPS